MYYRHAGVWLTRILLVQLKCTRCCNSHNILYCTTNTIQAIPLTSNESLCSSRHSRWMYCIRTRITAERTYHRQDPAFPYWSHHSRYARMSALALSRLGLARERVGGGACRDMPPRVTALSAGRGSVGRLQTAGRRCSRSALPAADRWQHGQAAAVKSGPGRRRSHGASPQPSREAARRSSRGQSAGIPRTAASRRKPAPRGCTARSAHRPRSVRAQGMRYRPRSGKMLCSR